MGIAKIFGRLRKVPEPGHFEKFDSSRASGLVEIRIDLAIPKQEKSLWCWVAVGSGVADFYQVEVPTQCRTASRVLGRPDSACCQSGDKVCNQLGYLHKTLAHFECCVDYDEGALAPERIESELQASRPIGVRVKWRRGSARNMGHFVALAGIKTGRETVDVIVMDPAEGTTSVVSHHALESDYGPDGGSWTHSFFTISPREAALSGGAPGTEALAATPELLGGA